MTALELATKLQCEVLKGNGERGVAGVSSLAEANAEQLAPYTDAQYLAQLKATKAGVILVKQGMPLDEVPADATVIAGPDPEMAFLEAVRLFHSEPARPLGIHPSSIIEPGVTIGADVHIGPFVFIESGTRIGDRCSIQANTTIGRNCVIGDDSSIHARVTIYRKVTLGKRVTVFSGVVLGADGFGYKFRGGKYIKVPHVGSVEISDDVEIGANTCIDRGSLGATRIGAGTKIDNLVQIAHNNEIGMHCILCGQVAMAGSCKLEDYVVLGGNVGVADHSVIGKGARAGAKTGIAGTIPAGMEVWGLFAREKRSVVRSYAALQHLPDLIKRVSALEKKAGDKPN